MQNDIHKSDDHEIIQQVLNGNTNAFEILMKRHNHMVLAIVKKHVPYNDIEETIQNIFIRAYRSLSSFEGKSHFKWWLSSIAVKTCYDYWRMAYRSREVPLSTLNERHREWLEQALSYQSEASLQEISRQKEAIELLDYALGKLSPEQRIIIELLYLEGLSGREAARLLGWSLANVKVRSFRARKKMKMIIEELKET